MSRFRFDLLLIAVATAAVAYVLLNAWSLRHAPPWKTFERRWAADVRTLEASGRLPPEWRHVKTIEVIGGTPETRGWLKRIAVPLKTDPRGLYRMDVLVVAWTEDGRRGVLIQYDIEDATTKNMVREIARTLILSTPDAFFEALPWLPL